METKQMSEIIAWMKTTDILEMSFKNGSGGFEFRAETAPGDCAQFPQSAFVPVPSPGIGIFRASSPGTAAAQEGKPATAGQKLGIVDMGSKKINVISPCSGRIAKILIQDSSPVEYGQPLYLISP